MNVYYLGGLFCLIDISVWNMAPSNQIVGDGHWSSGLPPFGYFRMFDL